jgi:hypothetical protein
MERGGVSQFAADSLPQFEQRLPGRSDQPPRTEGIMTSTRRIKLCLLLAACLLTTACLVPGAASQAPQPTLNPATAPPSTQSASSEVVWVNTASGYYHKPSSRHYGKTKHGKYMQESDAVRAGYRPARN